MIKGLVSVVVPIYNAHNYLFTCLSSLKNQTYSNIEVLMIDDGSKDDSARICQDFSSKDKRFKYIYKKNSGVCDTRNMGIELSQGEYLAFCDNDDWYLNRGIEILISNLTNNKSDISCGSVKIYYPHYNFYEKLDNMVLKQKLNKEKLAKFVNIGSATWGKLYKTEIIKKNDIRFRNLKHREDSIFFYDYMLCSNSISTTSLNVYVYNKLETNTACSKIYREEWKWQKLNYEVRMHACEKWAKNTDEARSLNDWLAAYQFCDVTKDYTISTIDENEVIELLNEAYKSFIEVTSLNAIEKEFNGTLNFSLKKYLSNNDLSVDFVKDFRMQYFSNQNNKIKRIIKKIAYLVRSKRYKSK